MAEQQPKHEFTDGLYGWITHTDLASRDPGATKAWCAKVLGWTFRPSFAVHVADAAAAFAKALEEDAEKMLAPTCVMDGVTVAIVRAPGGVPIGFSGP